eukprot:69350_1
MISAKCKTIYSRQLAYSLLYSLNKINLSSISLTQSQILKDPVWYHNNNKNIQRTSWKYHPTNIQKYPNKFVGLKNQGATDYINVWMQQLFIINNFRENILSARIIQHYDESDDDDMKDEEKENNGLRSSDNVLYQTQLLFGHLLKSQKKHYDTLSLCKTFKGFDGQSIPLGEQQDANEFIHRLFEQLGNELNGTTSSNLINDTFGGTIVNQMISFQCKHLTERNEKMFAMSLTVKNKTNLYQSLDTLIEGDLLSGDNKLVCTHCNIKRDAVKRQCFGFDLPKYLIFHLNRFEFDFNTMRRKKVNSRYEFDEYLNIKKYTKYALDEMEKNIKKDIKKKKNEELPPPPEEYYKYRLVGIIEHTGNADSGYYYFYGQTSNGKWWEFNDTEVGEFDFKNKLDEQCFGGKHEVFINDPNDKNKKIKKEMDKPYNAYMLIYKQILFDNQDETRNNNLP